MSRAELALSTLLSKTSLTAAAGLSSAGGKLDTPCRLHLLDEAGHEELAVRHAACSSTEPGTVAPFAGPHALDGTKQRLPLWLLAQRLACDSSHGCMAGPRVPASAKKCISLRSNACMVITMDVQERG